MADRKSNSNSKTSDDYRAERNSDEFRTLAIRFVELEDARSDATLLNRLLDELNCLLPPSSNFVFHHELGVRILRAGISHLSYSSGTSTTRNPSLQAHHDHLVTKFSPLVVNLLRRMIGVDKETLAILLDYHVRILSDCPTWVRPYVLNSLNTTIICAYDSCEFPSDAAVVVNCDALLVKLAEDDDDDSQTKRGALKCLENLTIRPASGDYMRKDQLQCCFDVFIRYIRCSFSTPTPESSVQCKIVVSSLIGLKNIVSTGLNIVDSLGQLLAALKGLMFYGLPGHGNLDLIDCLYPSPLSQSYPEDGAKMSASLSSSPQSKKVTRRKRRTTSRNRSAEIGTNFDRRRANPSSPNRRWPPRSASSSDSEHSDVDGSSTQIRDAARLKSLQATVRSSAIGALAAVFEFVSRKITFGYWSSFLPSDDVAGASAVHGTLVAVFLKDPLPKVRSGALALLNTMLDGSKPFLALADDRNRGSKSASFTALSQTLASMIRALQRAIVLALVSETASLVLTQAILSAASLVNASPLERLAPGFAAKFVHHLRPILNSHKGKDSNAYVATLTALGTIVGSKPALDEVVEQLETADNGGGGGSWLIDVCVANVACRPREKCTPLPVRIESLQVLAALVRVYFDHVLRSDRLLVVVDVIEAGLDDDDASMNFQSAKLLEDFGKSFSIALSEGKKIDKTASTAVVSTWSLLIGTSLPKVGPENPILVAKLCDCLSTMSADVFSLLPTMHQILCKTLLLGFGRDEDRHVKAASIRAIGALSFHPSIQEDYQFLADALDAVVAANAENENADVRIKAAWTLANLTDALCVRREGGGQSFFLDEVIGDQLLGRVCRAATSGCYPMTADGNDRVRSNAVRALGNILRYFGHGHLGKNEFRELANNSIDALHKCSSAGSNMKVRWNACYALGNGFRNGLLFKSIPTMASLVSTEVLLALSVVAKECRNFKVRIFAAAALAAPSSREAYGDDDGSMTSIVENLLVGLDNIESSMDFVAYQHKDNLVEQLCTSLCHLIGLLQRSDVKSVSAVFDPHVENFSRHLLRCIVQRSYDNGRTKKECRPGSGHENDLEAGENLTPTKKLQDFSTVYERAKERLSTMLGSSEIDDRRPPLDSLAADLGVIEKAFSDSSKPVWDKLDS